MMIRTIYSCDLCKNETENGKETDYLNVHVGLKESELKQVCRQCIQFIDLARGRNH